mmetsp:Transcript_83688/g.237209  ORF Transcript_83688/g.237209 Transcript_83688/m.237209 type:complete len:294 (+) Transcript_83688:53-934(+)
MLARLLSWTAQRRATRHRLRRKPAPPQHPTAATVCCPGRPVSSKHQLASHATAQAVRRAPATVKRHCPPGCLRATRVLPTLGRSPTARKVPRPVLGLVMAAWRPRRQQPVLVQLRPQPRPGPQRQRCGADLRPWHCAAPRARSGPGSSRGPPQPPTHPPKGPAHVLFSRPHPPRPPPPRRLAPPAAKPAPLLQACAGPAAGARRRANAAAVPPTLQGLPRQTPPRRLHEARSGHGFLWGSGPMTRSPKGPWRGPGSPLTWCPPAGRARRCSRASGAAAGGASLSARAAARRRR